MERPVEESEVERLRRENAYLRGLVALQDTDCVYCGERDMARCAHGFPGCSRADDILLASDMAYERYVDAPLEPPQTVGELLAGQKEPDPFDPS